jgi:MoaA/NifB/PqqE/SkfB family radical SAM enzyme
MVAAVKALGAPVELITNGTLLHENLSRNLMAAGIDVLWLSLDGATPESYADVRLGALLPEVIANVSRMRYSAWAYEYPQFHLGIVFVAMKRNIEDLPDVLRIGSQLQADRFIVTNVLPYTAELCGELLYANVAGESSAVPSPWSPNLNISKMDMNEDTREALYRVIRGFRLGNFSRDETGNINNYCPFIERGAAAIAWDGSLSPCLALMHTHQSYLHDRKRSTRRHVIGNVNKRSLSKLWNTQEYIELRTRVQAFDFSPCSQCGGCDLSEANEEDCFGNVFPTCGGCLWAQGVIQCP